MGLELPEILNLSRQMEKTLKNKIIAEIILGERSKSLIKQGMCNLDKRGDEILNSPIKSVKSRGKWIFIGFEDEMFLVFGEIIGKFHYLEEEKDFLDSYHVLFKFTDGSALSFRSSLYAFLLAADKEEIHDHKYAGNIGLSPVDEEFTYSYFHDILSKYENKGIKGVLNLQGELSGLGNAYINDILYKARIHPKAKVSSLSDSKKKELYDVIIETVNTAINERGSIKEYDLFGETGNYVRLTDQPVKSLKCTRCGVKMVKMNVMGSSSYVCPQCQKI